MSPPEAAKLLDLPASAAPEQLEARFLELRAKLEDKIAKAPTPGLKAKYRESLDEITAAFEVLTLAADSSALPVLRRGSSPASEKSAPAASPSPASEPSRGQAPAPPSWLRLARWHAGGAVRFVIVLGLTLLAVVLTSDRVANRLNDDRIAFAIFGTLLLAGFVTGILVWAGSVRRQHRLHAAGDNPLARRRERRRLLEFVVIALASAALLGGGGWWVLNQRDQNNLRKRQAAREQANAERIDLELRNALSELNLRYAQILEAEAGAERELRNLQDALSSDRSNADLARRVKAQAAYLAWLRDYLPGHPARLAKLRAENAVASRSHDASDLVHTYATNVAELKANIASRRHQFP